MKVYRVKDDYIAYLTPADLKVKHRCCNFDLLEKMCKEYITNKDEE